MRWPLESTVPRPILAAAFALATLFVFALVSLPAAAADSDPQSIPANEAAQHVGETAQVCGHVASAAYFASIKGSPTFINLDRPYPDQTFTVVIWGDARGRFEGPPERLFDGKTVCVTGRIETYRGKPQIVVTSPDQMTTTAPLAGGGELSDLERVLVKALLASLGYDVIYGTGDWDEQTVEAVMAFQESTGLPTTGEPDAETLRALANAVPDIAEEDTELAIRLVLFELVRRQE